MINSSSTQPSSADRLEATVIRNGYCVGCGACASLDSAPFDIWMNTFGQYEARRKPSVDAQYQVDIEAYCPFSDRAESEDCISRVLYHANCHHDPNLGYYLGAYAGYVNEGDFREKGSSGGFGTWIVHELFDKGLIDYIIHVQPMMTAGGGEPLFAYSISNTAKNIRRGSKSRYYPIELSAVLQTVRRQPGRYALVGLPCFIKSVRLLQRQEPMLTERIQYCIGLVCGHLQKRPLCRKSCLADGHSTGRAQSNRFSGKGSVYPGRPLLCQRKQRQGRTDYSGNRSLRH